MSEKLFPFISSLCFFKMRNYQEILAVLLLRAASFIREKREQVGEKKGVDKLCREIKLKIRESLYYPGFKLAFFTKNKSCILY